MPMKFRLSTPTAPFLTIGPGGISLKPIVDAQAYAILPNSSLAPLFLLSLVSSGTARGSGAKFELCPVLLPRSCQGRCWVLSGRSGGVKRTIPELTNATFNAGCKRPWMGSGSAVLQLVRAVPPGVWFGVRWSEHCQSSVLSPQTGNVSAVINVRSGRIVGSLDVGRYRGEQPLTGQGVAGGVSVLGAQGQSGGGKVPGLWAWCGGSELGLEGEGSAWPSMGGIAPSVGTSSKAPLLSLCRIRLSLKDSAVGTFEVSYP